MSEKGQSFWRTVPGILSALAGLVTAVGAILALGLTRGPEPAAGTTPNQLAAASRITLADWATQANAVCEDGYEDMRAVGARHDFAWQRNAVPQLLRIATRIDQKLRALPVPDEGAKRIQRGLAYGARALVATRRSYESWVRGDRASARAYAREQARLEERVMRIDAELGAAVCAQGP